MRGRRCLVPMSVALLALVAASCSKKEAFPSHPNPPPRPKRPLNLLRRSKNRREPAGFGTVSGTVAFTGKAPEMRRASAASPTRCAPRSR